MNKLKSYLPFIVKLIISALFLLSAVAKLFPVWAFEKQLVDIGIVGWELSPYLSRLIIALEIAIAVGLFQQHYLKSFVIPLTLLLLLAFCVHLSIQMYQHGAMNGNCGCFGQLIPMTPLEAFIKNVITAALLIYLYKKSSNKEKGQNKFIYILLIYGLSAALVFVLFPLRSEDEGSDNSVATSPVSAVDSVQNAEVKTQPEIQGTDALPVVSDTAKNVQKDKPSPEEVKIEEPAPVQSKFSGFTEFGGKQVSLDKGKKIVCLFVPGCDHCVDAAKEIVALSNKHKLPPVYILFLNEETFKIPEFFKAANGAFPYQVVESISAFFKVLGKDASTPGVNYLWNGNIIRSYEGTGEHKFNAEEMIKAIEQNVK